MDANLQDGGGQVFWTDRWSGYQWARYLETCPRVASF